MEREIRLSVTFTCGFMYNVALAFMTSLLRLRRRSFIGILLAGLLLFTLATHANLHEPSAAHNLRLSNLRKLAAPAPQVALTFDDLPAMGALPEGMTRLEIARNIISALQAAHAPSVYGFVNAKALQSEPESEQVLREWRAAGFPLANHTFSHMDLNANSVQDFEQDILANEPTLDAWMRDGDWHWLRYPFLREGNTPEKHRAVLAFLKEHGYKTAQVTISFGDYAYNDPYARCLANKDQQGVEHLKEEYLRGAAESLEHSSVLAKAVFGRDIKHVMLLHIGSFESIMLPHLLGLLKDRGYSLVTLPQAQSDPAYTMHPDLHGIWEGSFLDQFVKARHLSVPADLTNTRLVELDAVCR